MTKVVNNIAVATPPSTGSGFYTVKSGDSLWKMPEAAYGHGHGAKYQEIFDANRPLLKDPDKIFPGQVLRIPQAADGTAPQASAAPKATRATTYGVESANHLSEWTQFSTARGAKAARAFCSGLRRLEGRRALEKASSQATRSDGSRARRRRNANRDSRAHRPARYGRFRGHGWPHGFQRLRARGRSFPAAGPRSVRRARLQQEDEFRNGSAGRIIDSVAKGLEAQRSETAGQIGGNELPPAGEKIEIFCDNAAVIKRRAVLQHERRDYANRFCRRMLSTGSADWHRDFERSARPSIWAAMRTLRA